jgi:hypothetical protein
MSENAGKGWPGKKLLREKIRGSLRHHAQGHGNK